MNVLDENIPDNQRQLLRSWGIPTRQIGYETGWKGMKDEMILPFLLQLRRPTFFTLDIGFYSRSFCHARYSLVCMDVRKQEAAVYVRRVLCHPEFNSQAKRMGAVIRVSSLGIAVWRLHAERETYLDWVA